MEKFCQFSWRPRPPCFLTNKQIREIKKNLKKYSVEFDVVDKMKISEISKELLEKRQAARNKFDKYRERRMEEIASQKSERLALRDGIDTDGYKIDDQEHQMGISSKFVSKRGNQILPFKRHLKMLHHFIEMVYDNRICTSHRKTSIKRKIPAKKSQPSDKSVFHNILIQFPTETGLCREKIYF